MQIQFLSVIEASLCIHHLSVSVCPSSQSTRPGRRRHIRWTTLYRWGLSYCFQWRISIDIINCLQEWQPLGEETDVILLFDDDEDSVIALGDPIRMIPIIGKITTELPISSKVEFWRVYFQNLLLAGRLVLVSILPSASSLLLNLFTNNLCFWADGKLSSL